ncbi:MAG: apolipoprotein N-acyltransferase, partial [Thermogutta sp.]|nr:apolipoprotein N-acyltransferase [Thermogutta sp.]
IASDAAGRAARTTAALAGLGAALLWAAHPPLQWAPLAWIALWPWFGLIESSRSFGRRDYAVLYAAGLLFWLSALHWLRLPHWATSFGWIALSVYLAVYAPLFIGITRIATRRLKLPLPIAAAVVWMGLEVCRGNLLTGFGMANLAHTQYRWISLIQCADLFGDYGVGGLIVAVSACLYGTVPWDRLARLLRRRSPVPNPGGNTAPAHLPRRLWQHRLLGLVGGAVLLTAALLYGQHRLHVLGTWPTGGTVKVALIQGSEDIRLDDGPEKMERIHRHYLSLSHAVARSHRDIDVMIWPETVYGGFLYESEPEPALPSRHELGGMSEAEFRAALMSAVRESRRGMEQLAAGLRTSLILGVETQVFGKTGRRFYNSAAFIAKEPAAEAANQTGGENAAPDSCGTTAGGFRYRYAGRFDKMHLVMFGEYVPFADRLPWIQGITPLSRSTTPGREAAAFEIKGLRFSPNICFESAVPQAVGNQVRQLTARGQEPDVLVNLTNDGWFWGSSELDMHLACGVFRGLENRKPFLIAANTGFSAVIDPAGRILQQGPRRAPGPLVAEVGGSPLRALYTVRGPVFNSLWVGLTLLIGLSLPVLRAVRRLLSRGVA